MSGWKLVYTGFEPAVESLREALCTLGNGYLATRGAAEECEAGDIHYPGTYLAGGYNRLHTKVAGRIVENEDLVNMPNWMPLSFRPEGGDMPQLNVTNPKYQLAIRAWRHMPLWCTRRVGPFLARGIP